MHTTNTPNSNLELLAVREQLKLHRLYLKLTMIRVQTKALQTLERLMDDPEPSGDEKKDRFEATKRNRQRLAANQTLIHCRTAERERRLAKSNRQANSKLKGLEPNRASDGWQASEKTMLTDSFSPRGRRCQPTEGRMTDEGAVDASDQSPSGCATDPSPQPTPAHFNDGGEAAEPIDNTDSPHGLRPISDRTQTMPPKLVAPNKFIKPKHPCRSRKRKNRR